MLPELFVEFTIWGNHLDRQGNAVPYTRTTQRGKWVKPAAKRYFAWQDYVRRAFQNAVVKAGLWTQDMARLMISKNRYLTSTKFDRWFLNVKSCFTDFTHGDPINITKGIEDALFLNDRYVGSFSHLPFKCPKDPFVFVKLFRVPVKTEADLSKPLDIDALRVLVCQE
jgi:hypothetical protein